jgi:uncharacterized RDD family membrane protein YckC
MRRSVAYVFDVVLLFAVLAPLAFVVRSLVDVRPHTGFEIWIMTVTTFSIPVWLYFALCDASRTGATLGKRAFGVAVAPDGGSGRVSLPRALVRTAVKLAPWELAHLVGFALAGVLGPAVRTAGLVVANVLALVWFGSAVATGGARSVHDLAAGTRVRPRSGHTAGPDGG